MTTSQQYYFQGARIRSPREAEQVTPRDQQFRSGAVIDESRGSRTVLGAPGGEDLRATRHGTKPLAR